MSQAKYEAKKFTLSGLILVLVVSLHFLKPANPNAAAAESTNEK